MALSTGQITDVFQQVLHRNPTGAELAKYGGRGDLEGAPGQQALRGEVSTANGLDPSASVNATIEKTFQALQNEVVQRYGEYTAGKPFRVDEVLAEKTANAKEQIDPYYDQILGDYLTGVQRKIQRGTDDTKLLLGELDASTASYNESAQNTLDKAIETADKGYAEAGLFGSGDQLRAEGQATQAVGADVVDYNRKAAYQKNQANTALNRTVEDTNLDRNSYVTNLEQNRLTDTSSRAAQLTKEAGQQYIQGFQATLPTELQTASGFDMLKSLGIYS